MILLDTHAVLWLLSVPERLSSAATRLIKDTETSDSKVAISCCSMYEIAYGVGRKRILIRRPIESFLLQLEADFAVLAVTRSIMLTAAAFAPPFPSDPFDRIIAATALTEGIPLITADERIQRAGIVKTIW